MSDNNKKVLPDNNEAFQKLEDAYGIDFRFHPSPVHALKDVVADLLKRIEDLENKQSQCKKQNRS